VNNVIKEHDNIVTFLSPIGKGIYPLYVNVANPVQNGVFTSDGTNSNAIANANLKFNGSLLDVTGRIQTTGTVIPGAYAAGQTIKTTMVPRTGLTNPNYNITSYSPPTGNPLTPVFVTFATYSYTPESASSQIIIDFFAKYSVDGNSSGSEGVENSVRTDSFISKIDINGTTVTTAYQQWLGGNNYGTGSRSGTIFPLMGAYTNSTTDSKLITISISRFSGDDSVSINQDEGVWLRITEIGR
jgi:hypothetical protein